MSRPIQAGDLCEVIDGMLGPKSPNLGLIVKVIAFVGDHTKYGRIWSCDAEYAVRGQEGRDRPAGLADFAQSWLRRIDVPPMSEQIKEEHAAGLDA
jgi:hypothetical protein